jgi:hypothetical protein
MVFFPQTKEDKVNPFHAKKSSSIILTLYCFVYVLPGFLAAEKMVKGQLGPIQTRHKSTWLSIKKLLGYRL